MRILLQINWVIEDSVGTVKKKKHCHIMLLTESEAASASDQKQPPADRALANAYVRWILWQVLPFWQLLHTVGLEASPVLSLSNR
jgi:hypothetical protein